MSSTTVEVGLSEKALLIHRALASLQEELEAVDDYNQRADTTQDEALKAILEHNRDDEMEHAIMLLEWVRRKTPALDVQMRKILFQPGAIVDLAKGLSPSMHDATGLGLGNLK